MFSTYVSCQEISRKEFFEFEFALRHNNLRHMSCSSSRLHVLFECAHAVGAINILARTPSNHSNIRASRFFL